MENIPYNGNTPSGEPPKKHIGRDIAVIAGIVVGLLAAALLFTALVLPHITGEKNEVSRFITQQYDENTPAQVIQEFVTAFNNDDRDAMAKCYAPNKRLTGNLQAGGLTIANGALGLFGDDNKVQIQGELTDLNKDGDNATGKVIFSAELPFVGKQSATATVTFVKKDYHWYIDAFSDFSSDFFSLSQ